VQSERFDGAAPAAGIRLAPWVPMAARAIWKGAITFGLVTIPVGLFSAVERKGEISFRLLHAKDMAPIDYKRFCEEEGVEVPWSDIVKGYEHERGQYVVVTDEDFDKARVPGTQAIEITDFVPADAIEGIYFDHPYYAAPSGRGGTKAYALLRDALTRSERIGVGTIVLRQREHLVAVEPAADVLAVTTMRWAHEVRPGKDLDVPARGHGFSDKEMKLALQLIETLESDWRPEKYTDTYRDVLLDIIGKKIAGEEIAAPKLPKPKPVASLMRALEKSLETPKKGPARMEHRQPAAGRRGRRKAA
jgi:DNA end-binding protein Ku